MTRVRRSVSAQVADDGEPSGPADEGHAPEADEPAEDEGEAPAEGDPSE
jgi:hypothetical protein